MTRVLTLCLSLALIIFGVTGVTLGAAHWMIALNFIAAAVGLGLDAVLWATHGRWSVIVAFGMALALVGIFLAGIVVGVAPWLSWSIFGVGAAFFAIGCARKFAPSMYGGELQY